jgi:quercetin dioxygenase-like cupin family protein
MKVQSDSQIDLQDVTMPGSHGCKVRWLIGKSDEAPNFAMREFEVEPGGYTPKHHHPYEHEVFVLDGEGVVIEGKVEHPLRSGDVVYVQPNEVHQFRNSGDRPLKFLCLVPNSVYHAPITPECGNE